MEDDDDNNLFGEFTVYVIVALLLLILPFILIAVAKLLYVEPSQASVSGNDVKYPEGADEQKMADCINKYIANYPASPYNKITNIGKYFVDSGKQYNIHPGYIVAMSQHESTLCANSAAKGCLCYNGWGRKAGTSQPECQGYGWYAYTSWEDGIGGHTKFVKEEYYERRGLKTVQQITPVYCPADDGCDVEGYTSLMISESEKAACAPLTSSGNGKMSQVPLIKQASPPWGQMQYGNCSGATYANSACGATSLTMVIDYFTGQNYTPNQIGDQIVAKGWRPCGQGTAWAAMTGMPAVYELNSKEIGVNWTLAQECFQNGGIIIASMGDCQFTSQGHFIVLTGYSGDTVYINDPGGRDVTQAPVSDVTNTSSCAKNFWCINNK